MKHLGEINKDEMQFVGHAVIRAIVDHKGVKLTLKTQISVYFVSSVCLCFSMLESPLIVNKLIQFCPYNPVLPMIIGNWSPCLSLDP